MRRLLLPEQDVDALSLGNVASNCMKREISSKAERGCLQELCMADIPVWNYRKESDGNIAKDKEIHGESNMWRSSLAMRTRWQFDWV